MRNLRDSAEVTVKSTSAFVKAFGAPGAARYDACSHAAPWALMRLASSGFRFRRAVFRS
jgi:hypothetical protein